MPRAHDVRLPSVAVPTPTIIVSLVERFEWDGGANLFLLLQRASKLRCPFIRFLPLRFLRGELSGPLAFDILAHSAQRCAEVVLVPLDDHLELADVACLVCKQAVLLAL